MALVAVTPGAAASNDKDQSAQISAGRVGSDLAGSRQGEAYWGVAPVTGSLIRRRAQFTPAPTLVLTRRQWDDSGKFSLGDFLQTLPQQGNAHNLERNNADIDYDADGTTQVNLRSL